jgi:hypothetical protein
MAQNAPAAKQLDRDRALLRLQSDIRRPGLKRFQAILKFRREFPLAHFVFGFHRLFPHKGSVNDLHGTAFPRSHALLFANTSPRRRVPAVREIFWAICRCLQHGDDLSRYLEIRRRFEVAVLQDDAAEANSLLDAVEEQFGKSVWCYQNRIAVGHLSTSDSEPADIADRITEETESNRTLSVFLYFIRRRIEGAVLREKLKQEIDSRLASSSEEVKNYIRTKTFDVTDSTANSISGLLFYDAQSSLIDHFDSLVFALQAATSDQVLPNEDLEPLMRAVRTLHSSTGDDRLSGVLIGLGASVDVRRDPLLDTRAEILELYTGADYVGAALRADTYLQEYPDDSAIRVLRVKAWVALGAPPKRASTLVAQVEENLFNLFAVTEDFFRSTHALLVMADRFYDHRWMLYIRVVVLHEIGAEQPNKEPLWLRDIYIRDFHLTPFTIVATTGEGRNSFVQNEHLQVAFPLTWAVMCQAQGLSPITHTDSPRGSRYRARFELASGNYHVAAEHYVLAAAGERAAVRLRSLGGASLAQMLQGDVSAAIETAVGAYLENPRGPTLLPLARIVDGLQDPSAWPNSICLGILFDVAAQFGGGTDLSRQRLAFELFSRQNDIPSPEHLAKRIQEFGAEYVISYLDRVWRPEIMRQTLLYSDNKQIEEARIEACKVLTRIDPSNARSYQEEMAARIKQQEIAKATMLVEQSKVYVDTEAIKRNLKSKLGTSYAQYKSALGQLVKPSDDVVSQMAEALAGVASASLPILLSNLHLMGPRETLTQSELQFNALFSEVTREFLKGDHGLNAYLSTRVRHGKLVDALRKPVVDQHLVTQKSTGDAYARNVYWGAQDLDPTWDRILPALEAFARSFDKTLLFVRDRLIQIRTLEGWAESSDSQEGLFLYRFSNLERKLMQSYDIHFKDFEEFIVKCVDTLWEKTDLNLNKVRTVLDTTVRGSLMNTFDDLMSELRGICGLQIPGPLANAIARARTATQQSIDTVIGWFRRSEVYDRPDFDIDFPPQIAFNMVGRTMSLPEGWQGPQYSEPLAEAQLPGRTLDGMVDIYYVLFENAVKYAEAEGTPLSINVGMRYEGDDYICSVESYARPPTPEQLAHLQHVRETLATPESRRLAQQEGRSGFRKIWLALDNPFYREPKLDFVHGPNEFTVTIKFKTTSQV